LTCFKAAAAPSRRSVIGMIAGTLAINVTSRNTSKDTSSVPSLSTGRPFWSWGSLT
jgi:hypothetical protein